MNKGRNIAILLLCLVSLSLLTFLTTLNRSNKSNVEDNVRYKLVITNDNVKEYEFYFIEDEMKTGSLISDFEYTKGGDLISQSHTLYITDHPYKYTVTGNSKKEAELVYEFTGEETEKDIKPYELYTEKLILSLIYGAKPVLSITEAIIIGFIAIIGGLILGKAEDIWTYFNKDTEKEYPDFSDLKKYKITGISALVFAVVLLLVFLIF